MASTLHSLRYMHHILRPHAALHALPIPGNFFSITFYHRTQMVLPARSASAVYRNIKGSPVLPTHLLPTRYFLVLPPAIFLYPVLRSLLGLHQHKLILSIILYYSRLQEFFLSSGETRE